MVIVFSTIVFPLGLKPPYWGADPPELLLRGTRIGLKRRLHQCYKNLSPATYGPGPASCQQRCDATEVDALARKEHFLFLYGNKASWVLSVNTVQTL